MIIDRAASADSEPHDASGQPDVLAHEEKTLSFTKFVDLPKELRLLVWKEAVCLNTAPYTY